MVTFATGRIAAPAAYAAAASIADHPLIATGDAWTAGRRDTSWLPYLGKNDIQPVCTSAGMMNAARWLAHLQGFDLNAVEAMVQPFYAGCVGCAPTDDAIMATAGASVPVVMSRLAEPGYDLAPAITYTGIARRIPDDSRTIANCIARFGFVGAGVGVDQTRDNFDTAIWTAGSTAAHEDHFVPLLTADQDVVTFATWGQIWAADWGWIDQNLAEAWVVIFPQLVTADGTYLGTPINDLMAMFEEAP